MPQYRYTALAQNGAQVVGECAAVSVQALEVHLQQQGLYAQRIQPKLAVPGLGRSNPASPGDFLLFVQEMAALMRAGLPLPEVLELASERPSNPALGRVLVEVLKEVRAGQSFSGACAAHADTFDPMFLAAVRTGEKTGELPAVLARYQDFLRRRVALRKKVAQALAYPVFLLLVLVAILGLLFLFVMPRFAAMYANFNASLPAPTQWLLTVVGHFPWIVAGSLVLAAGLWAAWRVVLARPDGRLALDAWKLRAPLVGAAQRTQAIVGFTRNLSTLLAGGTPLLEALRIVHESFPNRAAAAQVQQVASSVEQGESLARSVQAVGLLPDTAVKMIRVGEASGALDQMLSEVAGYYEEILDTQLARLMALVEPVLVLLMGLLIGGIIIVMYLPIFNLAEVIR